MRRRDPRADHLAGTSVQPQPLGGDLRAVLIETHHGGHPHPLLTPASRGQTSTDPRRPTAGPRRRRHLPSSESRRRASGRGGRQFETESDPSVDRDISSHPPPTRESIRSAERHRPRGTITLRDVLPVRAVTGPAQAMLRPMHGREAPDPRADPRRSTASPLIRCPTQPATTARRYDAPKPAGQPRSLLRAPAQTRTAPGQAKAPFAGLTGSARAPRITHHTYVIRIMPGGREDGGASGAPEGCQRSSQERSQDRDC